MWKDKWLGWIEQHINTLYWEFQRSKPKRLKSHSPDCVYFPFFSENEESGWKSCVQEVAFELELMTRHVTNVCMDKATRNQ